MKAKLLPRSFYEQPPQELAKGLIGCVVQSEGVSLRITETEAYGGPQDSASHARFGCTARNEVMWGPGGRVYVYLCYGLHQMFNVVCGPKGQAGAVLVRSAEPVEGLELIRSRRGGKQGPVLLTGPGKVGAALAVDRSSSGGLLYRRGGVCLIEGDEALSVSIASAARVGIDFADEADRRRAWRFADVNSLWVTHRKAFV